MDVRDCWSVKQINPSRLRLSCFVSDNCGRSVSEKCLECLSPFHRHTNSTSLSQGIRMKNGLKKYDLESEAPGSCPVPPVCGQHRSVINTVLWSPIRRRTPPRIGQLTYYIINMLCHHCTSLSWTCSHCGSTFISSSRTRLASTRAAVAAWLFHIPGPMLSLSRLYLTTDSS